MVGDDSIKRGQIWWYVPKMKKPGHVQNGNRPVIVLSTDSYNAAGTVVNVCPCTTKPAKPWGIHVPFSMMGDSSTALINQVTTVNKFELEKLIGEVSPSVMGRISKALVQYLGLERVVNHINDNKPDVVPKNSWSLSKKASFIHDCDTNPIEDVRKKYGISNSTIRRYYNRFNEEKRKWENCSRSQEKIY